MPTKIIDTASYTAWPRAPVRDGNNHLVFVYWDGAAALSTFSFYEARSTDNGATWVSTLINYDNVVWCIAGAFGVTAAGTLLVATSAYALPYPSTPNNAPRVWRKTTAGSWTRVGDIPQPAGDSIFVPFGRVIQLPGGVTRITCCGWDAARTYAHIYYVDSTDDGQTWGNLTTIKKDFDNSCNELCYYAEGNNHLVITRREDEYGTHEGGMRQFVSTSAGASGTWVDMGEVPAIVGKYASAPDIMALGGGRIALLYGDRGEIAYYGTGQQHSMRMVVGNFTDIMASVNGWSANPIIVALTYPETNADSGYGGMYKVSDVATLLQVIYHDGSQTDTDIWHESLDSSLLVGEVKRIIAHGETGAVVYCTVTREADGYILDGFTGGFSSTSVYPYTFLAEHSTIKGRYETAETRSTWNDGKYVVTVYKQAGTDPAPASDTVIASGEMKVENDIEVEELTLSEIEGSAVLAKEATVQSILTIVTLLKKYVRNKKLIVNEAGVKSLVIYDDNGTTELVRKTLKDPSGNDITDIAAGILAIENASSV